MASSLSSILSLTEGVHYRLDDECWDWLGRKDAKGYGISSMGLARFHSRAYRAAYVLVKGEIADGLVMDHLCRNPSCINPDHLEPVTFAENIRRGDTAKLTFDQAREIRRRVAEGEPYAPIAAEFGVTEYVMWQIAEDITWREDPDAPRTPVRPERFCRECGARITSGNRHKVYCCVAHRRKYNSREGWRRRNPA